MHFHDRLLEAAHEFLGDGIGVGLPVEGACVGERALDFCLALVDVEEEGGDGGAVARGDDPAVEALFDLEGDTAGVGDDDGDALVDGLGGREREERIRNCKLTSVTLTSKPSLRNVSKIEPIYSDALTEWRAASRPMRPAGYNPGLSRSARVSS